MKQTFLFSLLLLVIRNCSAEKITLRIDLNEPIAVTDPKFLSLTIDPVTLLAGNAVRYVQRVFIINQFSSIFLPINRYFERSKFKKDYILSKYTSPRIFFFFLHSISNERKEEERSNLEIDSKATRRMEKAEKNCENDSACNL